MEFSTDIQNSLPQEQAQMSPLPGNFSSPTVPATPRTPPTSNTDDATSKARKKGRNAELCALRSKCLFLDLPSPANTRLLSQQNIRAHTQCPNLHPMENAVSTVVISS